MIALTSNIAIAKGGRIDFEPEWFDIDERRHARRQQTGTGLPTLPNRDVAPFASSRRASAAFRPFNSPAPHVTLEDQSPHARARSTSLHAGRIS